jgi:hypothetical protein
MTDASQPAVAIRKSARQSVPTSKAADARSAKQVAKELTTEEIAETLAARSRKTLEATAGTRDLRGAI